MSTFNQTSITPSRLKERYKSAASKQCLGFVFHQRHLLITLRYIRYNSSLLMNPKLEPVSIPLPAPARTAIAVSSAGLPACIAASLPMYASHPMCIAFAPMVFGGIGSNVATQANNVAFNSNTIVGFSAAMEKALKGSATP
jgi:hypothetical protein